MARRSMSKEERQQQQQQHRDQGPAVAAAGGCREQQAEQAAAPGWRRRRRQAEQAATVRYGTCHHRLVDRGCQARCPQALVLVAAAAAAGSANRRQREAGGTLGVGWRNVVAWLTVGLSVAGWSERSRTRPPGCRASAPAASAQRGFSCGGREARCGWMRRRVAESRAASRRWLGRGQWEKV